MTGDDVVDGQDVIDELCWRFGQGTNNAEGQPTDPFATERDDSDTPETPSHADVGDALRENVSYDGDEPAEWDIPEGESVEYHAVLRARERSDELLNTANWELIGYAAALGKRAGLPKEDILQDLQANPTPQYGYDDARARKEVRGVWRKMDNGSYNPPSVERLKARGILPEDYVSLDEICTDDTLSGKQKWEAWSNAREAGDVGEDSIVPDAALEYLARKEGWYDFSALPDGVDELPVKAKNKALYWLENKWWDPDGEKATTATARNYKSVESAPVWTWEDVRYIYEKCSKNKGRQAARDLLDRKYDVMTLIGAEDLQLYDPETGVYNDNTAPIRAEIYDGLDDDWTRNEKNEILAGLRQENNIHPSELNGRGEFDDPHICANNGVLNLFTEDLKPHSSDYYFVDRVPVTYNSDADTGPYEGFLDTLTEREGDAKAMMEMVGHALVPDAHERKWKKFLILTGDSDNGKSVFFDRVRDLLDGVDGEEGNVQSVKLSKMSENDFSKNTMYGSMANIAGEINGKKIRNTADIKDITGGDKMEIEPKGRDSFSDTMNTTLMFAANDPPIIGERDKRAIATRIVPIELPFTFVDDPTGEYEKQKRPERELEEELATPDALSGFLNLALDGIQRMKENSGDVSLEEPPMERLSRYEETADPMKEFAKECLTNDPDDYVVKPDVTTIYEEYATDQGYELGSNTHDTLHQALRGSHALDYTQSYPSNPDYSDTSLPLRGWDKRKYVVDRMTLTEKGLEYAESAGLVVDTTEGEGGDEQWITDCGAGMHQGPVRATVAEKIDPPEWLEGKGHLVDGDGGIMPYVIEGSDVFADSGEDETVEIENVKVEDRDGVLTAVLSGITDISDPNSETTITVGGKNQQSLTATTDGGEIEETKGQILEAMRTKFEGESVTVPQIAPEIEADPDSVKDRLETLAKDGRVRDTGDGYVLNT